MGYTDDLILNRMTRNHEDNPEPLAKAMNKAGLVQKEVQVRGKNGQVFTRKQWVKASEDQSIQKPVGKQEDKAVEKVKSPEPSKFTGKGMDELLANLKEHGYEMDGADKHSPQEKVTLYKDKQEFTATFNKYRDGGMEILNIKKTETNENESEDKKPNSSPHEKYNKLFEESESEFKGENGPFKKPANPKSDGSSSFKTPSSKQDLIKLLQSGASREDIMAQAEKDGVTWKKSDHAGINWMRASMAMTGLTTKGSEKQEENNSSSTENNSVENKDDKPAKKEDKFKKLGNKITGLSLDSVKTGSKEFLSIVKNLPPQMSGKFKELSYREISDPSIRNRFTNEMYVNLDDGRKIIITNNQGIYSAIVSKPNSNMYESVEQFDKDTKSRYYDYVSELVSKHSKQIVGVDVQLNGEKYSTSK